MAGIVRILYRLYVEGDEKISLLLKLFSISFVIYREEEK
jgi:hypothetical protein